MYATNRLSKLTLSPRELEIARLVAEGYSTKQIAVLIGIGDEAVKTYRKRICEKYQLQDRPVRGAGVLLRRLIEDGHVPEIRKLA
jgi:DNA-binding CsgD family transcriptional regulator